MVKFIIDVSNNHLKTLEFKKFWSISIDNLKSCDLKHYLSPVLIFQHCVKQVPTTDC